MTAAPDSPSDHPLSRRAILLLFVAVFILLLGRSMNRDLDPDEHQFVAPPALLVQDHLLPYVDYPYFHMPNLVFIYAALTGWTSYKLLAARVVMTLCGTGTVVLLFAAAYNTLHEFPRRFRWALSGGLAVIFISSRMFTYTDGWAWNHDMPVLCTLAAFLLHLRGMRQGKVSPIVTAGFLLGLATGIRLSFALAPIPFILSLFIGVSPLNRRRRLIALKLGATAALVAVSPAIWLMLKSPSRFFFGNLAYPHLSTAYYRSIHYTKGFSLLGKIGVMLEKFLLDLGNAVLLLLFVLAVAYLLRRWRKVDHRSEIALLAGLLTALCIGTLGPTPIQPQYCYMLVPFMVLLIVYALASLRMNNLSVATGWARAIGWVALIVGAIMLPIEYWGIVFLPIPRHWTPIQQHRRAEWIKQMVGPNARIMTTETTVPLEAGLKVYPEYAVGRFVLLTAKFQSEPDRRKYGMVSQADLPDLLNQRPPDAIFIRSTPELETWAMEHQYRRIPYDKVYTLWIR
jgi:4-amino-4-deoxy-L-arabinose transferase-like glycosyltransferase